MRFQKFLPTVSIGRHQVRVREARLGFCLENDISVIRRPTAGGALYLDPGQFCFSLVVESAALGANLGARLGTAANCMAEALAQVGVATSFKAPNDLQVEGRQKIASVFLAERGASTLIFGVIIAELDLKRAMQALLVPTEKLTVTGLEHAKERMVSLTEMLGDGYSEAALQLALRTAFENRLGRQLGSAPEPNQSGKADTHSSLVGENWELNDGRFETKDKTDAATLRLLLGVEQDGTISVAQFSTDAHFAPANSLIDLGNFLKGASAHDAVEKCENWFASHRFDGVGLEPGNIARLVERAISKWSMQSELGLSAAQTTGLMLAGEGRDTLQVLSTASVMLVPYCAKPNWCKWRHTIDCVECGKCEVGDAYMMARERNMDVVTITNFEHLADTLQKMRDVGVKSYVGMCCGEFFLKRHHAFRNSGMDAVLMDIEGATCYELKEEHLAYAGKFTAEAALDIDAVKRVMAKVPVGDASNRSCVTGLATRPGDRRKTSHTGCSNCGCGKSASSGENLENAGGFS